MPIKSLNNTWFQTKLGDVLELKYGKNLPAKNRDGIGAPVYGSNGIVGNHSAPIVDKAGIVVGRKGSFGEVNLSLIPFSPIDTTYFVDELYGQPIKYWYYQLKYLPLTQLNRSTAIPGLNRDDAYSQEIRLPSLAEQKKIAAKLDELLAQVDTLKTRLDTIPTILKRFRQSVLAAAVSGKLTEDWREKNNQKSANFLLGKLKETRTAILSKEIENGNKESKRLKGKIDKHAFNIISDDDLPKTWVWTSFMDSMERVVDCHNKTAPYVDSGINLIRTPDIRNGKISLNKTRFVDEPTYEYWSRRCPPLHGDIMFTREAPMGEAGIIPENKKLCMGQRVMLLRPISKFVKPKYVLLNILSLPFQNRMENKGVGTAVKHLRVADVEGLTYPLAPIEEQEEIIYQVEKLFNFSDQIEQRVNDAQSKVNNLTQSILAKAFCGELTEEWREQNADLISGENSVQTLFECIKLEQQKLKSKIKTRKKTGK